MTFTEQVAVMGSHSALFGPLFFAIRCLREYAGSAASEGYDWRVGQPGRDL
jgi:hypothetical protein